MKLKINLHTLLFSIIFIPLIKPVGLTYNIFINSVFQAWKLFSLILMILFICKHLGIFLKTAIGNTTINKEIWGLIIFEGVYIINSIIRHTLDFDLINNCVTNILLIFFIVVAFKTKRDHLIKSIDVICSVYLICQIMSMILERVNIILLRTIEGEAVYFFGPDNYSAFITIPLITLLLYLGNGKENKQKFRHRDWILLLALSFCYIWTGSVTAACSFLLLLGACVIIERNYKVVKLFSVRTLLFCLAAIIMIIMSGEVLNYFSKVFSIVGKADVGFTLNSRTYIWELAIKLIQRKPLFGYGSLSSKEIGDYILYGASHAHNIFLELLLRTGIIGMLAYFYFMSYPIIHKRKLFYNSDNAIILIAICIYIILSFMDFYPLIQAPLILITWSYLCVDNYQNKTLSKRKNKNA